MSIVMSLFVSASKPFGSNDNPPVILLEVMISSVEKEFICISGFAYVFFIYTSQNHSTGVIEISTTDSPAGILITLNTMPSTYAHYRFGRDILPKLPAQIRKIISQENDLFNIGLHGPDLLFYYHPLSSNPVNSKGYKIHAEPGITFFRSAAKEVRHSSFSKAYLAYVYGVICHFVLDRECHGYIDQKITESGLSHAEIEVEFDRRLMVADRIDPVNHVLTEHIRPNKRSAGVISSFYDGIPPQCIYHSMKSYIFYNRLMLAPNPIKRKLIFGVLRIGGHYDDMHGMIINYKANPKCRDSNKELMRRYVRTLNKAVQLICEFKENAIGAKPWNDMYNYTFGSEYVPTAD